LLCKRRQDKKGDGKEQGEATAEKRGTKHASIYHESGAKEAPNFLD